MKTKKPALLSHEAFATLTRDEMYQTLFVADPSLARGKTRARKDELIELYAKVVIPVDASEAPTKETTEVDERGIQAIIKLQNFGGIDEPREKAKASWDRMSSAERESTMTAHKVIFGEEDPPTMLVAGSTSLPGVELVRRSGGIPTESLMHIHGPDCNHGHDHELPKPMGVDDLVRVNPEMPTNDGHVMHLPADEGEPMFTFKDAPRELTAKENMLVARLRKNFEAFASNPTNNAAKREVRADIYALRTTGIIANPKFEETIKQGRAQVKELRAMSRTGVSVEMKEA